MVRFDDNWLGTSTRRRSRNSDSIVSALGCCDADRIELKSDSCEKHIYNSKSIQIAKNECDGRSSKNTREITKDPTPGTKAENEKEGLARDVK